MGKLLAICTSPQRGTVKTEVESARLTPEWGIETDAHGGNWHRQVSLLSAEKIENFRKKIWVDYGAFGENLVVEGYDFRNLPVTSRFAIGEMHETVGQVLILKVSIRQVCILSIIMILIFGWNLLILSA